MVKRQVDSGHLLQRRLALALCGLVLASAAVFVVVSPVLSQEGARQGKGQPERSQVRGVSEDDDEDEDGPRFDHNIEKHKGTKCESCHVGNTKAKLTNPQHSACDDCHSDEFFAKGGSNSRFCQSCHLEEEPAPWKNMEDIRYADLPHLKRNFYVEFSHKKHLEAGAKANIDSCNTCHFNKDDNGALKTRKPSHKNCGTADCHGTESELKLTLNNCSGCHIKQNKRYKELPKKARKYARNGLHRVGVVEFQYPKGSGKKSTKKRWGKFDHQKHMKWGQDMDKDVDCGTCHTGAATATKLSEVQLFTGGNVMSKICGQCHNGKKAKGYGKKVFGYNAANACQKCHQPGVSAKANFEVNEHILGY